MSDERLQYLRVSLHPAGDGSLPLFLDIDKQNLSVAVGRIFFDGTGIGRNGSLDQEIWFQQLYQLCRSILLEYDYHVDILERRDDRAARGF